MKDFDPRDLARDDRPRCAAGKHCDVQARVTCAGDFCAHCLYQQRSLARTNEAILTRAVDRWMRT